MGGGPSKEEAAAEAAVLEQQLIMDENRRARERMALEEMIRDTNRQRTEARNAANERAAAEQQRADKQRKETARRHAEARAREQQREETLQATNSEQAQRAVEINTQLLNALSSTNQQAAMNASTNHQSGLRDTMTRISQEEKEARERVLKLAEQREKKQDELHKEKEGYMAKKSAEAKDHQERILAVETSKIEIIKERTAVSESHENQMFCIRETFAVQRQAIQLAGEADRKEVNLIDAVHNVRQAGIQLSSYTSQFASIEYFISKGLTVPPKARKDTMTACTRSFAHLAVLEENAIAILDQSESRHPQTTNCQDKAREISEISVQLRNHLRSIELHGEEIYAESMKSFWTDIKECSSSLHKKVIDLPVVSRSDHTVAAISASVQALTGASIGRLGPKETKQQNALED